MRRSIIICELTKWTLEFRSLNWGPNYNLVKLAACPANNVRALWKSRDSQPLDVILLWSTSWFLAAKTLHLFMPTVLLLVVSNIHHTHTLPFYGSLSGTTRVCRYQKTFTISHLKRVILDFMRHGKDNRSKCADSPAGRHPMRTIDAPTSIIPPILRRMPFLMQPSQFILARDRHQICWIAYLEAWFPYTALST